MPAEQAAYANSYVPPAQAGYAAVPAPANAPVIAPMPAAPAAVATPAGPPGPPETPLMIIRFNQPRVGYERPLYETMVKALQVKPTAKFEIVSVSEQSSDPGIQEQYTAVADANVAKVMGTFQEIGMPPTRLHVSNIAEPVHSSEVRIYLR